MNKRHRARKLRNRRRKKERELKAKKLEQAKLDQELNTLNSIFGEEQIKEVVEEPVTGPETFRLSEDEKREILENLEVIPESEFDKNPKTVVGKIFNFFKKHVRPDIGLIPFKEGEGPDLANDDSKEIIEKLKKNARIGLKFTFKF